MLQMLFYLQIKSFKLNSGLHFYPTAIFVTVSQFLNGKIELNLITSCRGMLLKNFSVDEYEKVCFIECK